jgi:hypothetical protein
VRVLVTKAPASEPTEGAHARRRYALIGCTLTAVHKGVHRRVQKCKIKLTTTKVKLAGPRALYTAVLARGKTIYATGSAARTRRQTRALLTLRRGLTKGVYTLTLRRRGKTRRQKITIR